MLLQYSTLFSFISARSNREREDDDRVKSECCVVPSHTVPGEVYMAPAVATLEQSLYRIQEVLLRGIL